LVHSSQASEVRSSQPSADGVATNN
jgi:hypothetical protein